MALIATINTGILYLFNNWFAALLFFICSNEKVQADRCHDQSILDLAGIAEATIRSIDH